MLGYQVDWTKGPWTQEAGVPKLKAILGSLLFFVAAPVVVAGFVPWWITHWEFQRAFWGVEATRIIGVVLIIVGAVGLLDSFARFALQGLGTPAPIAPTRNLVVTGLYRYVRNPMYVAVLAAISGQAVLFCDWHLFVYGAMFWLTCHLFVVTYEEPTLRRTYAKQYETYRANVPRWIPRLTRSP
jgi:protein-S-isoprenylcysteine O-methyltransferase Ste14